jgi:hypothetical protein
MPVFIDVHCGSALTVKQRDQTTFAYPITAHTHAMLGGMKPEDIAWDLYVKAEDGTEIFMKQGGVPVWVFEPPELQAEIKQFARQHDCSLHEAHSFLVHNRDHPDNPRTWIFVGPAEQRRIKIFGPTRLALAPAQRVDAEPPPRPLTSTEQAIDRALGALFPRGLPPRLSDDELATLVLEQMRKHDPYAKPISRTYLQQSKRRLGLGQRRSRLI